MPEQQNPQEEQEAQIRISNRISGFFLGLIGALSLLAAVAFVSYGNSDRMHPMAGGSPLVAGGTAPVAKTVTVAMHDPGCHWFQVGQTLKRSMATTGPVNLLNRDEAALKIAGSSGVQTDGVGQQVVLAPGTYRITMVGQASDDNHLHLAVS
jgi:hypothetical protein